MPSVCTTTQAPHAHRTLYALVAGLPEHKIQVISPDIGGGFGNKVGIYPGYVCSIVGSIVTGAPVKWVEDRFGEPDVDVVRQLPHARRDRRDPRRQDPRPSRRCSGRPRRVPTVSCSDEIPRGLLPHLHRLVRLRRRARQRSCRVYGQGARWRCVRAPVPHHGGGVFGRAHGRLPRRRVEDRSGGAAHEEPAPSRAVPVHHPHRLGVRLRRLPGRLRNAGPGSRGLRRSATRAGGSTRRPATRKP